MAYTKRAWKDRNVQYPRRYTQTMGGDGKVTLEPAPGEVYQEATPVNASNMNHIEQGIFNAQDTADKALPKAGGAMSNTDKVENMNADLLDGKHGSEYAGRTHAHGQITTDGKVGTAADQFLVTGTDGAVGVKTPQQVVDLVGVSNPNILHNWDFRNPINQRGAVTGNLANMSYFYDRWIILNSGNQYTITLSPNGITLNGASIIQRIEGRFLLGKTVTGTVLLSNGEYKHATGTFKTVDNDGTNMLIEGFGNINLLTGTTSGGFVYIQIVPNAGITIAAVKLELGPNSTLHLDPPMDWAIELTKCKRFYQKKGYGWQRPYSNTDNVLYFFLEGSLEMRRGVIPTVSVLLSDIRDNNWSAQTGFETGTPTVSITNGIIMNQTLSLTKTGHGLSSSFGRFVLAYSCDL